MWLVLNDWCGLCCALATYLVVTSVYWGFLRIGIYEQIKVGDPKAALHFVVFQYHCFMIFWTHFKTMTSEPGIVPKGIKELHFSKLPKDLQNLVKSVGKRLKMLELVIVNEKKMNIDGSEVVDKSQLRMLNMGAEQTSSSDEDPNEVQVRKKRSNVSSSMQRGIDRLLRSTLDDQKKIADGEKEGSFIDKDGKIKFDRRLYDLDVFKTILVKI